MTDFDNKINTIKTWLGTGSINLFGRPFAGKDTQTARLSRYLEAPVIGGGDILRAGNASTRVLKIIGKGELAPSDDYIKSIEPYFRRNELQGKPLLLSSVGRMSGEEPAIINATNKTGHPIKSVIYIDVSEDEVMNRRKSSPDRYREDDEEKNIPTRLQWFNKYTLPVLETYEQMGILTKIDGMLSEDKVFEDIVDRLYNLALQYS